MREGHRPAATPEICEFPLKLWLALRASGGPSAYFAGWGDRSRISAEVFQAGRSLRRAQSGTRLRARLICALREGAGNASRRCGPRRGRRAGGANRVRLGEMEDSCGFRMEKVCSLE